MGFWCCAGVVYLPSTLTGASAHAAAKSPTVVSFSVNASGWSSPTPGLPEDAAGVTGE